MKSVPGRATRARRHAGAETADSSGPVEPKSLGMTKVSEPKSLGMTKVGEPKSLGMTKVGEPKSLEMTSSAAVGGQAGNVAARSRSSPSARRRHQ